MTKPIAKFMALGRMAAQLPPPQGLLPLAVVLVLWQIFQRGNSPYFPPPSTWWNGLVQIAAGGKLLTACIATLKTIVAGLALAIVAGVDDRRPDRDVAASAAARWVRCWSSVVQCRRRPSCRSPSCFWAMTNG